MQKPDDTVRLLGVPFENLSEKEAKARIIRLLNDKTGARIFTPNPDILWQAHRHPDYKLLLRHADLLLPDGVGIVLAARLCGKPLKARLTGIDTAEWILQYASEHSLSLYLLGGKPSVADKAADRLRDRFPTLTVCGMHHGYFDHTAASAENQAVLADIQSKAPHILFVCLGFPCQERWIVENTPQLPSLSLAMGLGGSLDVWSGNLRRAPKLLRSCGLEWLWRAIRQPRRFFRLIRLPAFLATAVYKNLHRKKPALHTRSFRQKRKNF